jgi:phage shock protein A
LRPKWTELGRATAERHRLEARSKELERERADLEHKVQTAVTAGRDDLAKAGISRQIDIEAQSNLLVRLLTDSREKIDQLNATLDAIRASHREAKDRLRQLSASRREAAHPSAPAGHATDRVAAAVERAEQVAERVTGVPVGPAVTDQKALDELHAIHREREVEERLARLKAGRS